MFSTFSDFGIASVDFVIIQSDTYYRLMIINLFAFCQIYLN
jgi:hypothetical protein